MCRFLLFKGESPVLLADLLTRPVHSIINQAFSARLRLDENRPINGTSHHPLSVILYYTLQSLQLILQIVRRWFWCRMVPTRSQQRKGNAISYLIIPISASHLLNLYYKDAAPCTFTSTLPAWNNPNLYRLCEKLKSQLVFAHVRAATIGSVVSEANCHPWYYGRLM
jgi:glutamine amidotransferase